MTGTLGSLDPSVDSAGIGVSTAPEPLTWVMLVVGSSERKCERSLLDRYPTAESGVATCSSGLRSAGTA